MIDKMMFLTTCIPVVISAIMLSLIIWASMVDTSFDPYKILEFLGKCLAVMSIIAILLFVVILVLWFYVVSTVS